MVDEGRPFVIDGPFTLSAADARVILNTRTMPSVYLAGPVTGLTYEQATEWRYKAKDLLASYDIDTINPMRGSGHLLEKLVYKDCEDANILTAQRAIMDRCEFDVHRADLVIVNMLNATKVSMGTVMEVAWAYRARKPIVLAMEADNVHEHAMIRQAATYRTSSISEAVSIAALTLGK